MKKWVYSIFVTILFFSCSPKYTEYNDHGFGGGGSNSFSKIDKSELHPEIVSIITKDSQNSSLNKNFIFATYRHSQFKEILQLAHDNNKNKKPNIIEAFQVKNGDQTKVKLPVNTYRMNKRIPDRNSGFFHWYFFTISLILLLGIVSAIIYALTIMDTQGAFGMTLIVLGLLVIWMPIIGLSRAFEADDELKNKCLFTKIGVSLIIFPPLGLWFLIPGVIYDYFKQKRRKRRRWH